MQRHGLPDLTALAEMRGVKAEGGWAVVCTEQAEIHHSSEITPFIEMRIWDDQDLPGLARIADRIHEHGSLAGIELAYNGMNGSNLYSRVAPMGPAHLPVATFTADPVQARAMDLDDIADLRRWHRAAVRRRCAPATTSSTSTPGMRSAASTTSCRAATTIGRTPTAARHATACGCCARSSRTRSRRPAAAPRSPAGSPSTSCSAIRGSRARTSRR